MQTVNFSKNITHWNNELRTPSTKILEIIKLLCHKKRTFHQILIEETTILNIINEAQLKMGKSQLINYVAITCLEAAGYDKPTQAEIDVAEKLILQHLKHHQ